MTKENNMLPVNSSLFKVKSIFATTKNQAQKWCTLFNANFLCTPLPYSQGKYCFTIIATDSVPYLKLLCNSSTTCFNLREHIQIVKILRFPAKVTLNRPSLFMQFFRLRASFRH